MKLTSCLVLLLFFFSCNTYAAGPTIASISPDRAIQGGVLNIDITGSDFVSGQTSIGTSANLAVVSIRVTGPSALRATIVAGAAGSGGIRVMTPAGDSATLPFLVMPNSLQSTSSLRPTYLAGRTASRVAPDGVGPGAYLDSPWALTGCGGKLYFNDNLGLREADLTTRSVRTFTSNKLAGLDLWCDGANLYSASTLNGRLMIEQFSIATGARSNFSYPPIGSYSAGTATEYIVGDGSTLYTTDSASGRIWRIDLVTEDRSVLIDFGGPTFVNGSLSNHRLAPLGRFWTDGVSVYLIRSQTLTRIRVDTGETVPLEPNVSAPGDLWGDGRFLYFVENGLIRKIDLETGEVVQVSGTQASAQSFWGDGGKLYFAGGLISSGLVTSSGIKSVDIATGDIQGFVGDDVLQRVDGIGSDARFSMIFDPSSITLFGDAKYLYIEDDTAVRKFDKATATVSTLAGGGPSAARAKDGVGGDASFSGIGGVWSDGDYAYVSDTTAIRRIDLSTQEVRTIAGNLQSRGPFSIEGITVDGIGSEARFTNLREIWGDGTNLYVNDQYWVSDWYINLRKVELATGRVTTLIRNIGPTRGLWGTGRYLYAGGDHLVRRINLDTLEVEIIAGGEAAGSNDGVGTQARFSHTDGLWGDGLNLYLLDAGRRIRRINLATRQVSTIYNSAEMMSLGLAGDGASLYAMEGFSLRRFDAESSDLTFATEGQGLSIIDVSARPSLTLIHSKIAASPGMAPPAATAIWGYRNSDGVLVSEASVAAEPPILSGRIYAEVNASVNTGIALANPNAQELRIDFYFTDSEGRDSGHSSVLLPPKGELARFLNEPPFQASGAVQGTFTFSASMPVAAIAIRGFTNERSEFLVTTLPVANLGATVQRAPVILADYASGGGWRTQVTLVNPTDDVLSGTIRFVNDVGVAGSPVNYSIAARSSFQFTANSVSNNVEKGSVEIAPEHNTATPVALAVFAYAPAGTTLTEAGVTAVEATELASYVEATGTSGPDRLDSGIALANTSDQPVTVFMHLATAQGLSFGQTTSLTLPRRGQAAKFLSELFPTLPLPFTGVLHISSAVNVSATGLRGRYNGRNEFIVVTVPLIVKGSISASETYMPALITGGGYSTRLFLINPSGVLSTGTVRFLSADGTPVLLTPQSN